MTKTIEALLYEVAEEVLGKLAFLFSFPEQEERPAIDPQSAVIAGVSFSGKLNGTMVILIPASVLPEIAGNMLGTDEKTSAEEQFDAIREMVNVICGNLLPRMVGEEHIFEVSSPRILETSDLAALQGDHAHQALAKLAMEESQADLILFLREPFPELPTPEPEPEDF